LVASLVTGRAQSSKPSAPPRAIKTPAASQKWIGVQTGPLLPGVRSHLKKLLAGLPDNTGVMVYHIMPESPAVLAGLERYDVLLRADGQPVTNTEKLEEVLSRRNFGTSVRLDVIHEGQPRIVHVLVLERPASERPVAVPGGFSSGPVSVMVLSSDGRGNISSNTTVKQKLTYTDASGARHELTGDQIAEFHKRMREDEEFRKTVKDQRIEIQSESIHIGSGAAAGAAGSPGATITIQTNP
jgi:hypothetical protein